MYLERSPQGALTYSNGTPVPANRLRGAVGQDWFEANEPIVESERTWRKIGSPEAEAWPLGRYNHFREPYRGVPVMEPHGARGSILLVLAEPIGCLFQQYRADKATP
jgi:hypothetical protein